MIYNFELYYSGKIDLKEAVRVTAEFVAEFCEFYEAELICPIKEYKGITIKKGTITEENRGDFVKNIIDWIFENSDTTELFKLFIYNNPVSQTESREFDHHDDTCCWALNLTEEQFTNLKATLKKNSLPEDLFYDSSKVVCEKQKGILGFLGYHKCYTPKEYENITKK